MSEESPSLLINISCPGISDTGLKNSTYEVNNNDNIYDLKRKIAEKSFDVPSVSTIDRHILIFRGKILQNDQNLKEIIDSVGVAIENNTPTFHLVLKPMKSSSWSDTSNTGAHGSSSNSRGSEASTRNLNNIPTANNVTSFGDSTDATTATSSANNTLPTTTIPTTSLPATTLPTTTLPTTTLPTTTIPTPTLPTPSTNTPTTTQISQPTLPTTFNSIDLTFPINNIATTITIPSYDLLWIPPKQGSDDWAFCLSPVVIKKLVSLGIRLDPVALFTETTQPQDQSQIQPPPPPQASPFNPTTVGRTLANITQRIRRHHNFILLAIKLAILIDLLAIDRQLLYQEWPLLLVVILTLIWQSGIFDRYIGPIRNIIPSLQLHLPHTLPATADNEDLYVNADVLNGEDIDKMIAKLEASQQKSFIESIKGGLFMLIGSFIPSVYDSWLREERARRNRHTEAMRELRRKIEQIREEKEKAANDLRVGDSIDSNQATSSNVNQDDSNHQDPPIAYPVDGLN